MALAAGLLAGCDDTEEITNVLGLDCGLIASDLRGDWTVTLDAAARSTTNCDVDPMGNDGTPISTSSTPTTYPDVFVFASDESTSFQVTGGPANELIVSVEADSCLALAQIWEDDENAYLICVGTFDIPSQSFSATCDSVELDLDLVGDMVADESCDLNASIQASIGVTP
jgi:hypothetical protein